MRKKLDNFSFGYRTELYNKPITKKQQDVEALDEEVKKAKIEYYEICVELGLPLFEDNENEDSQIV